MSDGETPRYPAVVALFLLDVPFAVPGSPYPPQGPIPVHWAPFPLPRVSAVLSVPLLSTAPAEQNGPLLSLTRRRPQRGWVYPPHSLHRGVPQEALMKNLEQEVPRVTCWGGQRAWGLQLIVSCQEWP